VTQLKRNSCDINHARSSWDLIKHAIRRQIRLRNWTCRSFWKRSNYLAERKTW